MNYGKHTSETPCLGCEDRLKEAHDEIVSFFHFIKQKYSNVHCSWVYRDEKSQNAFFSHGLSRLEFPKSKHNKMPAEAIDIFQIIGGSAIFDSVFNHEIVRISKMNGFKLRYGADFKSIGDSGHFELI